MHMYYIPAFFMGNTKNYTLNLSNFIRKKPCIFL